MYMPVVPNLKFARFNFMLKLSRILFMYNTTVILILLATFQVQNYQYDLVSIINLPLRI